MGKRLVPGENVGRRWHSWHMALIAVSLCAASVGCSSTKTWVDGAGCLRTQGHATIQVDPFGGWPASQTSDAGYPPQDQPKFSTTGIVTQSTPSSIVVDSCAPNANCTPMPSTISLQAPGLTLAIPVGSIVSVSYLGAADLQFIYAGGSGQLLIKSVGAWGGKQDPAGDGKLYVAAVDGSVSTPAGAPFSVAAEKIACSTYKPMGQVSIGDYALRFSAASGTHVTVQMGQTKSLTLAGQKLHASDLRSFQSDATDSYWDWAYWVAP